MCLTTALLLVEAAPVTAMSYLTVVWGLILDSSFSKRYAGHAVLVQAPINV